MKHRLTLLPMIILHSCILLTACNLHKGQFGLAEAFLARLFGLSDAIAATTGTGASTGTTTPITLSFTGSPYTFSVNAGITTITPTTTGTITNCTVSPSLPAGLRISSSTCEISGTPTVTGFGASYTINMTASTSIILKIMGTEAHRV